MTFKCSIGLADSVCVCDCVVDVAPSPGRCLWEILCTIDQQIWFSVQLSATEGEDFLAAIAKDWRAAQAALTGVDVRNAKAWKDSDRLAIAFLLLP